MVLCWLISLFSCEFYHIFCSFLAVLRFRWTWKANQCDVAVDNPLISRLLCFALLEIRMNDIGPIGGIMVNRCHGSIYSVSFSLFLSLKGSSPIFIFISYNIHWSILACRSPDRLRTSRLPSFILVVLKKHILIVVRYCTFLFYFFSANPIMRAHALKCCCEWL